MFASLTAAIGAVAVLGVGWALFRTRDVFHPTVLLAPMCFFMYVVHPLALRSSGHLQASLSPSQIDFVQLLNLVTVSSLLLGCLAGGRVRARTARAVARRRDDDAEARALWRLGVCFAALSLATWAYNLGNAGGFAAAYSVVKGGGTAESGYLRDFFLLGLPAIALLLEARHRGRAEAWGIALVVAIAFAFLAHGLLAARRGPTFNILVTLIFSWYLVRARRPSLVVASVGGFFGGCLLLALVTFRGDIYLGTDFFSSGRFQPSDVPSAVKERLVDSDAANEYVYGAIAILRARGLDRFYYGRRYLTVAFVRPVPSHLWPDKYRDVGMSELTVNAGVLVGVTPQAGQRLRGAAPGMVADLYVEFSWGCAAAAFLLGWLFGRSWALAVLGGGIWTAVYVSLAAVSIHLVAQTGVSFLHKALLLLIPTALGWAYFSRAVGPRDAPDPRLGPADRVGPGA